MPAVSADPAGPTDPVGLPPLVAPPVRPPWGAPPGGSGPSGPPVRPPWGAPPPDGRPRTPHDGPPDGRPRAPQDGPPRTPPGSPSAMASPAGPDEEPVRPRRHRGRRRATRSGAPRSAAPASSGTSRAAGPDPSGAPEPGAAPQPAAGRAGRNLPAAIGVGAGLGAAILVPLFLFRPAFLIVLVVAVGVGIWEMVRAIQSSGVRPPLAPLLVGGVLMVGLAWWAGPDALSLGLLVTVLSVLIWRLGDGPAGYQRDMTAAVLVAVYVPFLGGFAALLSTPPDGSLRVVVTLAAVVLSDTGGYAAGVWLGRHPMAPSVSPKKSWEGFAGSVLAAALGSAVLLYLLLDVAPLWGALFGLAISGAAVLGDLGESMIKRDLGVKDMSNLLPGHGGLMDRLDSILFAVPVAYLLLAVLKPAG
ncbi:phosphatidate cytidylyltransferase [Plantactinospora sp. KBS50]|nr:phosphatidate cytidylyltransferase [Plantactinospora sp. KBS50]